jgi:energy-coupling factor transport system substrate-specific component
VAHAADAPWIFALVLPLVLAVLLAEVADGALDAKGVAMLGVLAAVGTALRPLGAGLGGFEPVWLVIVLGGRALGPGFGFALGSVTMFSSALVTAGVGPWLPFQMLAAGWVGLGAGLLPARRGRTELAVLAAYGACASVAYGFVMNLWFWPFMTGTDSALSFVPGGPVSENLQHWLVFSLATGLGFDLPRAVLTAVLVLVAGRPVLTALRRATRRAAFDVPRSSPPPPHTSTTARPPPHPPPPHPHHRPPTTAPPTTARPSRPRARRMIRISGSSRRFLQTLPRE